MSPEIVSSITDSILRVWAVVGPLVAALLATWLTQRHQDRMEKRRELAQIAAEHRQSNRQLYLDALNWSDRAREKVGAWAIVATLYVQGTNGDEEEKKAPRWKQIRDLIDVYEKEVRGLSLEGRNLYRTLRGTGAPEVADRLSAVIETFRVELPPIPSLPVPRTLDIGVDLLGEGDRAQRIAEVDSRLEQAVADLPRSRGSCPHEPKVR